jgi:DNA-binding NtrC family response regulator
MQPSIKPRAAQDSERVPQRILVADDNELAVRQLQQLLEAELRTSVDTTTNGADALVALTQKNYSLLITDLRMPQMDGIQLIEEIQRLQLPVTVIVTTGHGSLDEAVRAMRLGAYDFITKPIEFEHLRLVARRALRERTLQDEIATLRERVHQRDSFHSIVSRNPRMREIFELVGTLAHTKTTVLIEGETGTGKEVLARAIHQASDRRNGPLVAVNCAALPESLLESELFGHEKGSFTSAIRQRRGRFELADGGTLFLDEVGDIPAAMQAKLLRVLQERRFERVGGAESIEVDVRVIGATNRSLLQMVREGTFREDLYYRLNVVKITLPPLRERKEDIALLAAHFARKYCGAGEDAALQIAPEAMEALLAYRWPGNIRELENAIERACIVARNRVIHRENLPSEVTAPQRQNLPANLDWDRPLPELLEEMSRNVEREYIRKALEKTEGHLERCAEICGMSPRSLAKKIEEYQFTPAAFRKHAKAEPGAPAPEEFE